jgi:predicted translin family RNA/ssDNA-binding protein
MQETLHDILWEQYCQTVSSAVQQGNFAKAARVLREAFREAEELGEIHRPLVDAAYSLANMHVNQRRYHEAESLFRMVLEVREKLLGQTHDDVVDSLRKLAIVQILAFRAEALGQRTDHRGFSWSDGVAAAS